MADEFETQAVTALSALAHPTRLRVHRVLVEAGGTGMSAGAIADRLSLAASSLSFHLAHMQAAGMVEQRREGRSLIYSVNFERMAALIDYLQENCCIGAPPSPELTSPPATGRSSSRRKTPA
jgi:ArsR family transcriptional regulator